MTTETPPAVRLHNSEQRRHWRHPGPEVLRDWARTNTDSSRPIPETYEASKTARADGFREVARVATVSAATALRRCFATRTNRLAASSASSGSRASSSRAAPTEQVTRSRRPSMVNGSFATAAGVAARRILRGRPDRGQAPRTLRRPSGRRRRLPVDRSGDAGRR